MHVVVMGSGNIGGTLGRRWARSGHQVTFGVRDAASANVSEVLQSAPQATAAAAKDAARDADVVLLAVPGRALGEVLTGIASTVPSRAVIIDATNNLAGGPMNGSSSIKAALPDAPLFRAFNSLGWENFADPTYAGVPGDLLYCGPEGEADEIVASLIADVGLRPVRVGDLDQIEVVDSATRLWFALARTRGRHLGFKVLEG
jgi:predicted dinucleotide-binding enzyme